MSGSRMSTVPTCVGEVAAMPLKSTHEIIYPGDFCYDDLGKVLPEIDVGIALRKQFRERPNGNQRVLDLMSDARCERPKGRETFRSSPFALQVFESSEITKDDQGAVNRSISMTKGGG